MRYGDYRIPDKYPFAMPERLATAVRASRPNGCISDSRGPHRSYAWAVRSRTAAGVAKRAREDLMCK